MQTYFYRFDNQEAFDCVVAETGMPDNLDVIGVIVKLIDGEPVQFDGWHVNLPFEHAPWTEFQVQPENPIRVFWGAEL